jgi:capsular exopolysaccharide synthesis family protein
MVTSAVPQEGKTTLVCHLALSIARAQRKTLLIDCDLRRPALHHVFDIPSGPGLSEVLRGETQVASVTRPGPVEGLDILPAGHNSREATQILATGEMRKLLEQLRGRYDFVLIDCSPVLLVADALALGKRVDGVLLSVRPELSQMTRVQEAYERLTSVGVPVVGTVVNGIRLNSGVYDYGYGYYADVRE